MKWFLALDADAAMMMAFGCWSLAKSWRHILIFAFRVLELDIGTQMALDRTLLPLQAIERCFSFHASLLLLLLQVSCPPTDLLVIDYSIMIH